MKKRIDVLMVERQLVESRTRAQALIMVGQVFVGTEKVIKSGELVDEVAEIVIKEQSPYVSRGAEKMVGAHTAFNLDFTNKVIVDVGASTGGFTDYALQHGATKVYAIDVGTAQLAWRLRQDERVISMEKMHIRNVVSLPEPVDLWLVDVSFISLKKVLPEINRIALSAYPSASSGQAPGSTSVVVLFKPQFEAGKTIVDKTRGVITDSMIHEQLKKEFEAWCAQNNWMILGCIPSPIMGDKGNQEFFYYLKK